MPKWPNCGMKLAWNNLFSQIYKLHLINTTFSIGVWSLASLASPSILMLAKHAKICGQLKSYTFKNSYKSTKSFRNSMQTKKCNLKGKSWDEKTTHNVSLELPTSLKAWKKLDECATTKWVVDETFNKCYATNQSFDGGLGNCCSPSW